MNEEPLVPPRNVIPLRPGRRAAPPVEQPHASSTDPHGELLMRYFEDLLAAGALGRLGASLGTLLNIASYHFVEGVSPSLTVIAQGTGHTMPDTLQHIAFLERVGALHVERQAGLPDLYTPLPASAWHNLPGSRAKTRRTRT